MWTCLRYYPPMIAQTCARLNACASFSHATHCRAAPILACSAADALGAQHVADGTPDRPADGTSRPSSDVAFTPAVKAFQVRRGSREQYARMEAKGGFRTKVTPDLAAFLAEARSLYLATASADGQP